LIVDADLRRPSLSSPLALTSKPGIVDFLRGVATFEQVCRPLPSGVSIVPGQTAPGDAAPLLASARFKELLHEAYKRFDVILVDSAPALAVPDNLLVWSVVDRVILVANATATSVRDLRRAQEAVRSAGGRLLGVVLNQANPHDVPYYHPRYSKYYTASSIKRPEEILRRVPSSPGADRTKSTREVVRQEAAPEKGL
jgi:Mrp family chromosome partitioning ATPase